MAAVRTTLMAVNPTVADVEETLAVGTRVALPAAIAKAGKAAGNSTRTIPTKPGTCAKKSMNDRKQNVMALDGWRRMVDGVQIVPKVIHLFTVRDTISAVVLRSTAGTHHLLF